MTPKCAPRHRRQRRQYQERKRRGICVQTGCTSKPMASRVRCAHCAGRIAYLQSLR